MGFIVSYLLTWDPVRRSFVVVDLFSEKLIKIKRL